MPYKEKGRKKNPWRGTVTFNGQRHSEMFATEREAKRWEVETLKDLTERNSKHSVLLCDVLPSYLKWCETNRKPSTVVKRTLYLSYFVKALSAQFEDNASIVLHDLTSSVITKSLDHVARTRSNYTANMTRDSLSAMWKWALERYDELDFDPFLKISTLPVPQRERKDLYTPTDQDIHKILSTCSEDDALWIELFIATGGREREVYGIRWEDIDWKRRKIFLASTKARVNETVYQPVDVNQDILNRLSERMRRSNTAYVFESPVSRGVCSSMRKRLHAIQSRAGVRRFGFHGLRRYLGSALAREGRPMKEIQHVLRHETLATTEKYVRGLAINTQKSVETVRDLLRTLNPHTPEDTPGGK